MATRTWTGATNNNWGTSTNWAEGFVPTNADDVIFSTNVNCSVTSSAVCKTINFGTYSGTFLNTGGLTVSGNVTLGASIVWGTFSSNLVVNANATLTSNGKDIPRLQFSNTITVTLADNWTVSSILTFTNATITVTLNGFILYVSGTSISHGNSCTVNGTTELHIIGSVSWTAGTAYIFNPIKINTSGTFTLLNNWYIAGAITYLSGTWSVAGSTTVVNNGTSFTGAGIILNNLSTLVGSITITLNNDLTILGNLTTSGSTVTYIINGSTLYVGGSINPTVNTTISGTTNIVMNGTGNLGQAGAAIIKNNLTINTSGTITFAATINYNTGTFTYVSGTIITTGSSFFINTNTTLDTNTMLFNIVRIITTTFTLTLNSTLNVSNYIEVTANTSITFAGTHGFITPILQVNLATNRVTMNFKELIEYKITSQLNFKGAIYSARHIFQSSHGTLKALITLSNGAYQRTTNVDYTRIDASGGATLWTIEGTINDSINCNAMESYKSTIGKVN